MGDCRPLISPSADRLFWLLFTLADPDMAISPENFGPRSIHNRTKRGKGLFTDRALELIIGPAGVFETCYWTGNLAAK